MPQTISQLLLPEFDHEMANTRRALERVPAHLADWKPHPKSMTMGTLAWHLAGLPAWITRGLTRDEFDRTPGSDPGGMTTTAALLERFDTSVAEARHHLGEATDEVMQQSWTFKRNGQTVFSQPKLAVVRTMALNHVIHHRAQLTVYLRLNDIPVPSLYGPSADER
ncbi:MAG: hypothetical protein ABS36_14175 [Acidobacteria bacterium SCN 69-37]|nr:MAG: hypothetical protein ABS36_14175 [Acidobacteria bacterium SCN 69-37]